MEDVILISIIGGIFIFAVWLISTVIEYKRQVEYDTYKGVYYGNAKKSAPSYTLLKAEIDHTTSKAVLTIREEIGYRTVERYRQKNYVKYPVLSDWKVKTKDFIRSVPLVKCSEVALKSYPDEIIRKLAADVAVRVKDAVEHDIKVPEKISETRTGNVVVTVHKIEGPKKTPQEEKDEYRLDGVEINAEKGFAVITFYDKISEQNFDMGIPMDSRSLESLHTNPNKYIRMFASDIRKKIAAQPESMRSRAILQSKINQFWSDCDTLVDTYTKCGDIETLTEFLKNVWDTRDRKTYAIELHFLTIKAINGAYPHREEKEENIDLILYLCELDISNYDNLKELMNIYAVSLISPQKKVIILEKKHLYNEALEFSVWCKEHNIQETRDKSFDDRIARLTKKCGGADEKTI